MSVASSHGSGVDMSTYRGSSDLVGGEERCIAGWLKKQGQDMFNMFRRRWFVLCGRRLVYYTNEKETDKKGEIDLSSASMVGASLKHVRQGEYVFNIITGQRLYVLEADTLNDMEDWVKEIGVCISRTPPQVSPLLQSLIEGGLAPGIEAPHHTSSMSISGPSSLNGPADTFSGHHGSFLDESHPAMEQARREMEAADADAPGSLDSEAPTSSDPAKSDAGALDGLDTDTLSFINSVLGGMSIQDPAPAAGGSSDRTDQDNKRQRQRIN